MGTTHLAAQYVLLMLRTVADNEILQNCPITYDPALQDYIIRQVSAHMSQNHNNFK